jgi:hypothetical protein
MTENTRVNLTRAVPAAKNNPHKTHKEECVAIYNRVLSDRVLSDG